MTSKSLVLLGVLAPLVACSLDDAPIGMGGSDVGSGDPPTTADPSTGPASAADSTSGGATAGALDSSGTAGSAGGCGDGVVDEGEECDDGGESATCDVDCTTAVCGDGVINAAAGEACDDQGESDACNDDCTPSACGDGVVNMSAGEECDEAATTETCRSDCTVPACGDGILDDGDAGDEECDDGNTEPFDGCSNTCTLAPAVVLDGDHVLDTDAGALDGRVLVNWNPATATWHLGGFEITAAGTLTVVGSNALTLEVGGEVRIAGRLDVSGGDGGTPTGDGCTLAGAGGTAGPGGFSGGAGAGEGGTGTEDGAPGAAPDGVAPAGGGMTSSATDTFFAAAGGGGGGHSVPGSGAMTNAGAVGGVGGEMFESLPPLIGGGGGGGGGVEKDGDLGAGLDPEDDEGTGGGGGGGAVAIYATDSITVSGTIDASGGDGGDDEGCPQNPGFGGGGAGGTILLDAPAVDAMMGLLDVSGGAGGTPTSNVGTGADAFAGGAGSDGNVSVAE